MAIENNYLLVLNLNYILTTNHNIEIHIIYKSITKKLKLIIYLKLFYKKFFIYLIIMKQKKLFDVNLNVKIQVEKL